MELLKNPLTFYLYWVYQHLKYRKSCRLDYMARVEHCTFEGNNRLYRDVTIKLTSVGKQTYIGRGSHVQRAIIGQYCSVGTNVTIGGGVHYLDGESTHPDFEPGWFVNEKTVEIGNDVYIGTGAIILDGVRIGNGAIIAAGSVVSHNVRRFQIVGGVPAVNIGERKVKDESYYEDV